MPRPPRPGESVYKTQFVCGVCGQVIQSVDGVCRLCFEIIYRQRCCDCLRLVYPGCEPALMGPLSYCPHTNLKTEKVVTRR